MKKNISTDPNSANFAVSEIFTSIQGESSYSGRLCFFIRLAGCNLNCSWCDTKYARKTTKIMNISQLLSAAKKSKTNLVEITGGEPLAQPNTHLLCKELIKNSFELILETNGSLPINNLPKTVKIILDCKTPSSGEHNKMLFANFAKIRKKDEIKFVIADKIDYKYSLKIIEKYKLKTKTEHIFFSPVIDKLKPKTLAEWMIKDKAPAIFAIQLHKIIWGKNAKGK